MSITAITWAALYTCATLLTFTNPIFGCLGYLLEYYQRPELRWWGDELPELRYNLMISIALATSLFLKRSSLRQMVDVKNPALRWLVALTVVMVFVTISVAVDPAISWTSTLQWSKMAIIFPLLVVGSLRSRRDFDFFAVAHVVGGFRWGYEAWMDPKRAEGRLMNVGSGDSLNDNAAAAHLLTVLPFAAIYALTEKTKWMRAAGIIGLPFIINTIILCNSRGSMVALAVAMVMAILLVRRGYRFRLIIAAVATALTFLALADEQFIERQKSTADYEEDAASQERLESWRGAFNLIQDRPLGAGGKGYVLLSAIYIPDVVAAHGGELRAPHNTWALVMSEWGVVGFICYIGVFAATFIVLRRVKKRSPPSEDGYYYWRAFAIQIAIIAYLVASTFTDRFYAEAGWWMVGLAFGLYRVQATELAERTPASDRPDAPGQAAPWTPSQVAV